MILGYLLVLGAFGLLTAWLAGGALVPAWLLALRRRPSLGRWTPLLASLPLALGLTATLAAVIPGDPHGATLLGCHCATSVPGWVHLCPLHPASALPLLAPALAVLVLLGAPRLRSLVHWLRAPRGLGGDGQPELTDLHAPTALLVGWLRPTLAVDPRLWSTLDAPSRAAVLAHERAHLTRRDPLVLHVLRLLTLALPMRARRALLDSWLERAELQADAHAARVVGDPLLVADALVRCARLGPTTEPALGWTGGRVERRVHALLGPAPALAEAPDWRWGDALLLLGLQMGLAAATPWLHHELEHLLNLFR